MNQPPQTNDPFAPENLAPPAKPAINIDDLYKQLTIHETLIVTCNESAVEDIRTRLSKKKFTENRKLAEFADSSLRLSFKIIKEWEQPCATIPHKVEGEAKVTPSHIKKCKLRITLSSVSTAPIEGIDLIETAIELEDNTSSTDSANTTLMGDHVDREEEL